MADRTDILSEIARLRREKATAAKRDQQSALADALDNLDAMGALESLRKARFPKYTCWGPKSVYGLGDRPYVGAIAWHRGAGYYGFKTLTIWGVWAVYSTPDNTHDVTLLIGSKQVAYGTAFYSPDAYMKLMRDDYAVYYKDDGGPPAPERIRTTFAVQPDERLAQRTLLRKSLATLIS
ncbi:MAG: hypothetical protein KME04_06125 [Pleurocapsa minor GSE-CHR-MK-17-07R]|jgi:hypothetical protein|nr:hypothetical protein [Pleurocapsa minor GSE-CHR-MK 17-07R]